MRKAALQPVHAIDNQGRALLLFADKVDHALELGAIALGRAFDNTEHLDHLQVAARGIVLKIGKLGLKRMPCFLFWRGDTGENNGWFHGRHLIS
ncbi:MAG: hypothetical protein PHW63_00065 [Alphaproteobacteria bacterium]|nr:hypothetical protein [Alphaproteobacteria bacterium]